MKGEEVLNILSSNPSTIEKCPKMKKDQKKVSLGIEIFFDLNFCKSFVLCRQKIELEDVPSNSKSISLDEKTNYLNYCSLFISFSWKYIRKLRTTNSRSNVAL